MRPPSPEPRFYSQNGEDVLADLLLGHKRKGFFVEVGCIDGRRFSNTLHFEERGWKGLCIEAHPDYIGLLQLNRPGSIVVHAAAGERDAPAVRFYADKRGGISTLDPSNEAASRRVFRPLFTGFEERSVPMLTLDTIFRMHAVQHIDVLSLDIEGMEVEALKGMDLTSYRPTLLVIESESPAHRKALETLLLPAGYHPVVTVQHNLIFSLDPAHRTVLAGRPLEGAILTHTANPVDKSPDLSQAVRFYYRQPVPDQLHLSAHIEAARVTAPAGETPTEGTLAMETAQEALAQGRAARALQYATQARDAAYQQEPQLQPVATIYTDIAALYLERGRLGEAQAVCEQAIRTRHDVAPAYALLSRIHQARGNQQQAERAQAVHRLLKQLPDPGSARAAPAIDAVARQAVFLANRLDLNVLVELGSCGVRPLSAVCGHVDGLDFLAPDIEDAVTALLSDLTEPALFVLHAPAKGTTGRPVSELLEAILYHPIRNHAVLLHRTNGSGAFEQIAIEQMLRQRDNPLRFQIETRGNQILIYPSRKHLHAYRAGLAAVSKSRFGIPFQIVLPAQLEPRWLDLPLFISYPRSGSHWINAVMELYFDRPRLRANRITFLPLERDDYLWLHDHDMGLHLRHDRVLYLYRNPVDVLFSYSMAERKRVDEAFVRWHMQHLRKHLEKYLLSDERAHTVVRYEHFLEDFQAEFNKAALFFNKPLDPEQLAQAHGLVTKDALASKGADSAVRRYINTFLLEPNYQAQREKFRDTYGPMIEEHIISGELEPFFA